MTGETHDTDDDAEPIGHDRPVGKAAKLIAERRLAQITEVLGLDRAEFERSHRSAAEGSDDRILAEQAREAAALLAAIPDPLVRLRLVELLTSLAADEPD